MFILLIWLWLLTVNWEKLENAVEVLEEMESMGCSPCVVSYNTLIAGHCDKGLLSSSLKFKKLDGEEWIAPDCGNF